MKKKTNFRNQEQTKNATLLLKYFVRKVQLQKKQSLTLPMKNKLPYFDQQIHRWKIVNAYKVTEITILPNHTRTHPILCYL